VLALAGIGLALARPQWGEQAETSHQFGQDILFVLDCSRSMLATDVSPSRMQRAKLAILDFVQRHGHGRVGLVAFAGQAFLQCPLTFDYAAFQDALTLVDDKTIPIPGTDIGRALEEAYLAMDKGEREKLMVVVTDGGDTMSKVDYQEAVRAAETAEAILYSIIIVPIEASAGRDIGGEHALIQLSADTGGKYFYAASLPQLDDAFRQISDELRTQYLLAYYPSQRVSDSDFRHIQVTVAGLPVDSGFKVRHRTGYYTSKSH